MRDGPWDGALHGCGAFRGPSCGCSPPLRAWTLQRTSGICVNKNRRGRVLRVPSGVEAYFFRLSLILAGTMASRPNFPRMPSIVRSIFSTLSLLGGAPGESRSSCSPAWEAGIRFWAVTVRARTGAFGSQDRSSSSMALWTNSRAR